jgi:hypothetical protein
MAARQQRLPVVAMTIVTIVAMTTIGQEAVVWIGPRHRTAVPGHSIRMAASVVIPAITTGNTETDSRNICQQRRQQQQMGRLRTHHHRMAEMPQSLTAITHPQTTTRQPNHVTSQTLYLSVPTTAAAGVQAPPTAACVSPCRFSRPRLDTKAACCPGLSVLVIMQLCFVHSYFVSVDTMKTYVIVCQPVTIFFPYNWHLLVLQKCWIINFKKMEVLFFCHFVSLSSEQRKHLIFAGVLMSLLL